MRSHNICFNGDTGKLSYGYPTYLQLRLYTISFAGFSFFHHFIIIIIFIIIIFLVY